MVVGSVATDAWGFQRIKYSCFASLLMLILPKHIYLRYFLLPLGDVFINAPPPLINGPIESPGSTLLPPPLL